MRSAWNTDELLNVSIGGSWTISEDTLITIFFRDKSMRSIQITILRIIIFVLCEVLFHRSLNMRNAYGL